MKRTFLLTILASSFFYANAQSFTKVYDSRVDTTIKEYFRPQPIAVGDLDKNGLMDLLICGEIDSIRSLKPSSDVYLQVDTFVFRRSKVELIDIWGGRNLFTDYNSDNQLDIFLSGTNNHGSYYGYPACNYIMRGDSIIESYIKTGPWNSGNWAGDAATADINNDGYLDAVTIGWSSWGGASWSQTGAAFSYQPDEGFSWFVPPRYPAEGSLGLMDFNLDGYVDYFVSGRYMNSEMTPFSHINFQTSQGYDELQLIDLHGEYNLYAMLPNTKFFDFNGDGLPDIMGRNLEEGYFCLFNNGNNTFQKKILSAPYYDVGDYDNDGDLDLISAYNSVQRNQGDFNLTPHVFDNFDEISLIQANFFDLDGDGDLDIIEMGRDAEGKYVTLIYRNNILLPNISPQSPKYSAHSVAFNEVKFTWDRGSDFESPDLSLTYNYYCRSIGDTLGSPMADLLSGRRYIPKHGNAGYDTLAILKEIPYGTYYWAVQSIDLNFQPSLFSDEEIFIVRDFQLTDKRLCIHEKTRINYIADIKDDYQYLWDFSEADTVIGTGAGPYLLRWDTPGEKLVKLQVFNVDHTLLYETSDTVLVMARPTSDFDITPEVALNEITTVDYKGNTSAGTFNWDVDGALQSPTGPGPHEVSWNTLGEKTVSLEVVNTAGCASPITQHTVQVQLSSSFGRKDTICQGEETIYSFTGISGPETMFNWSFNGAEDVEGNGKGPYNVLWGKPGEKIVTLQLADGLYYSDVFSDTVFVEALPVFSITGDSNICHGEELTLDIEGANADEWIYLWSNGAATRTMTYLPDLDTSVSLTAMSPHGCLGYETLGLNVVIPREDLEICLVTVSGAGKNMLVWEKRETDDIAWYRIYKESATAGFYTPIGDQSVHDLSVFVDENSDPAVRSNKYRLAIVDTCGNESPHSPFHKTIHLAVSEASPSGFNLSWDHIRIENSNNEYGTYYIYRGNSYSSLELIEQVPSDLDQYTDPDPPIDEIYYQVSAKKLDACVPTGTKKGMLEEYGESFSNVEDIGNTSSRVHASGARLRIYPNPFTESTTIAFSNPGHAAYQVVITDLTGKVVRDERMITGEQFELKRGGLESGVYIIKIIGKTNFIERICLK